jgi:hypothetical protein
MSRIEVLDPPATPEADFAVGSPASEILSKAEEIAAEEARAEAARATRAAPTSEPRAKFVRD